VGGSVLTREHRLPKVTSPASIGLRAAADGAVRASVRTFEGRQAVTVRSTARPGATVRHGDGDAIAAAAHAARQLRLPLVLELASGGAEMADGVEALHGWGIAAAALSACSGVVPIVAVVTGPVVAGPVLLLGLADLVVMLPGAVAFVSGPASVAQFTGVLLGREELGGVSVHAKDSGLCALEGDDVEAVVGELLAYLPPHADEEPPLAANSDPPDREVPELRTMVPVEEHLSYDMRSVAAAVVDRAEILELWPRWAPQLVTGLARLDGRPVGVVANQPRTLAGTIDIAASQKGARFVRFCDAFNLPLVTLVDTPGFLPGKDLEWRGMIRYGAELAFAYAEATVPRVCVIVRKAFGGAYIVMDSKGLGNDLCLAWPGAEVAVMGATGAVQILGRRSSGAEREQLVERYRQEIQTPWPAAERGFVDAVIDPKDTRRALTGALGALAAKREHLVGRKHDSGPL